MTSTGLISPFKWAFKSFVAALFLLIFPQGVLGYGTEDHILYLPGHTETVEWSEEQGRVLFTCDYKSLEGVAPRKGESCGPEPRLSISKEDLASLKYVVWDEVRGEFIYDVGRVIERAYERFPKILFVISPDYIIDDEWKEPIDRGQFVQVQHPVNSAAYEELASRAGRALEIHTINAQENENGYHQVLGAVIDPFNDSPDLGYNPFELEKEGKNPPSWSEGPFSRSE